MYFDPIVARVAMMNVDPRQHMQSVQARVCMLVLYFIFQSHSSGVRQCMQTAGPSPE